MGNKINNGGYFLEATTVHTGLKLKQLQINSAAVFTTLTFTYPAGPDRDAADSNMLATTAPYGQNLAGATVAAGTIIHAPVNGYISAVTMSSGNCYGAKSDF